MEIALEKFILMVWFMNEDSCQQINNISSIGSFRNDYQLIIL